MQIRFLLALGVGALVAGCSSPPATARVSPPVTAPAAAPVVAPVVADPYAAFNLGFEDVDGALPRGWTAGPSGYDYSSATDEVRTGARSFRIQSAGTAPFGARSISIDPKPLIGKTVRVHAWVKTRDVKGSAGVWVRVDGAGSAFDNTEGRGPIGTTDWTEVIAEVVNMTELHVLPDRYDAVIFVEHTTRARPLPRNEPATP